MYTNDPFPWLKYLFNIKTQLLTRKNMTGFQLFERYLLSSFSIPDQSNHDATSGKPLPEEKIFKDDELMNMIDPILATDDKNKDGYIDYPEFVQAQQAAQARQAKAPM